MQQLIGRGNVFCLSGLRFYVPVNSYVMMYSQYLGRPILANSGNLSKNGVSSVLFAVIKPIFRVSYTLLFDNINQ